MQCCMDVASDVRQSSFALVGDLARVSGGFNILYHDLNIIQAYMQPKCLFSGRVYYPCLSGKCHVCCPNLLQNELISWQ